MITAGASAAEPIAIVGMACIFPGAADLQTYWSNIVEGVSAIGEPPPDWHADRYLDPTSAANDRIYTSRGGWLGELAAFDPLSHGVMPSSVDGGEPDQYLALTVAQRALDDADLLQADRSRTGVIIGHGTYINRGFGNVMQHGVVLDQTIRLLHRLHPEHTAAELQLIKEQLAADLPPFDAAMAPGLVPNVMSGRIANRLDLMGPNFTVDAACASSLVALDLAIGELRAGRSDVMLVGGVHTSTPAPILQIFCQLEALSRTGRLQSFGADADGTLLGEGLGFLVLKRLRDAVGATDRISAVVRSVGVASDGRASGLLAPRVDGELLALRRAYAGGNVDPATVGLIEAHGTGTPAGDLAELTALREVLGEAGPAGPDVALGTVKTMISHLLPAAGMAGLIKVALALQHRVLPPSLHSGAAHPALAGGRCYLNTRTRPWIQPLGAPRRAGVDAFGFGGINAHAVLEEFPVRSRQPSPGPHPDPDDQRRRPAHHPRLRWPSEVILLAAPDRAALAERCRTMITELDDGVGLTAVAATAAATATRPDSGNERLAVVAASNEELIAALQAAAAALADAGPDRRVPQRRGTFCTDEPLGPGSTAFLFPGEGSPYPQMLADAAVSFPTVRRWFDLVDTAFASHPRGLRPSQAIFPPPGTERDGSGDDPLSRMDVGPESLFAASQGMLELLGLLGIEADATLGHSSGEWSALIAAGVLPITDRPRLVADVLALNGLYERARNDGLIAPAALLAVGAARRSVVDRAVAASQGRVRLAMDNCPHQLVFSGADGAIADLEHRLTGQGAVCERLPFDRAYHTAEFEPFADRVRDHLETLTVTAPTRPVWSACTGRRFPSDPPAIRDLAAAQWARPVRFATTIEAMYAAGSRIFIEVGPAARLTGFVRDILHGRPYLAVATDGPPGGLPAINNLIAQLFVHRVPLRPEALFAGRTRPSVAARPAPRLATALPTLEPSSLDLNSLRPPSAERTAAPRTIGSTTAVSAHLATMERFLQTEGEVLNAYLDRSGRPPSAGAAAPAGSSNQPWIDMIIEHDPGRRLLARHTFDLRTDRFLADHTIERGPLSDRHPDLVGLPIVPLTATLELAAQAAVALMGGGVAIRIVDIVARHWISLDEPSRTVQILAERRTADNRSAIAVTVSQSDPAQELLTATIMVAAGYPQPPSIDRTSTPRTGAGPQADSFRTDVYGPDGLFHGPSFQVVDAVEDLGSGGARAALTGRGITEIDPSGRLGSDVALLDGPGQVLALWLAGRATGSIDVFPVRVAALELYAPPRTDRHGYDCRVDVRELTDEHLLGDLDILDGDRIVARFIGWRDVRLRIPSSLRTFLRRPADGSLGTGWQPPAGAEAVRGRRLRLADELGTDGGGLWLGVLAHTVLGPQELPGWRRLDGAAGGRRLEWLAGRIAAKLAVRDLLAAAGAAPLAAIDIRIAADERGAPSVIEPEAARRVRISIAHSGGTAVAVAGRADQYDGIGVDVQAVGEVLDRLGPIAFGRSEQQLLDALAPEQRRLWAARLWAAKEAAGKASGEGLPLVPADLVVEVGDPADPIDPIRMTVRQATADGPRYVVWTTVEPDGFSYAGCLAERPDRSIPTPIPRAAPPARQTGQPEGVGR